MKYVLYFILLLCTLIFSACSDVETIEDAEKNNDFIKKEKELYEKYGTFHNTDPDFVYDRFENDSISIAVIRHVGEEEFYDWIETLPEDIGITVSLVEEFKKQFNLTDEEIKEIENETTS
ncbi:hypothetical protein VQL36_05990 [Chengkuizengella sp. SCS-71B]|uniref:hypothetical protein n=1 Tax=Chengkuizengella sp. SCS-71B TaxID=3115290 RepID=UPI0032C2123B